MLPPELELDIGIIGFDTGELDVIFSDQEELSVAISKEDEVPVAPDNPITRGGDIWLLGDHRLLCGDARDADAAQLLFADQVASIVITDPPYNVKVQGHVGGRGKTKHSEFAFASGEMSDQKFKDFLRSSLENMLRHTSVGALLDVFMDWRHIEILLSYGRELDLTLKNICVWNKTMPGQGSFYRSAHELIAIFAKPGAASTNSLQLGEYGRNRTNVWTYASVNTFQVGKEDDLALHPTVKPVAMIADAVKDASKRGETVFDPFLVSGTTLLAAEKTGRRCFGFEYQPKYADTAILR